MEAKGAVSRVKTGDSSAFEPYSGVAETLQLDLKGLSQPKQFLGAERYP